jgi:Spy/CpxP family protein refolding chaperone
MKSIKTLAVAAALLAGASSLAMAQSTMSQPNNSTEQNAAKSGGPGTHVGAPKTGTAESNAKVLHNQNGYKADHQ